ncbi:hypothetical protein BGZ65_004556 [Modicella reniformis]|uniref:Uncharacterized protein n=1 Tax=Modicella reniformis TaxID=1440133 RepID=A0A9P6M8W7_9FUNG|nr:hypothetical protein BGZ65_004556 [Modicella reniformis]
MDLSLPIFELGMKRNLSVTPTSPTYSGPEASRLLPAEFDRANAQLSDDNAGEEDDEDQGNEDRSRDDLVVKVPFSSSYHQQQSSRVKMSNEKKDVSNKKG